MTAAIRRAGAEAIAMKGWWRSSKWLVLRRLSQLAVVAIFLVGPLTGWWLVKGNLASSLTLDLLPLTDPYVLLQSLVAGHAIALTAIVGALIVLAVYLIVGGRVYCSWVCPVNVVTDAAHWLRLRLRLRAGAQFNPRIRWWLLAGTFVVAAVTGTIAWELVNPVSIVFRGLVFGVGLAWAVALGIFLLDLFVGQRAWCGHFCPVGAFYGLIGRAALVRVSAADRSACTDCKDCFVVCPEPKVITPALYGADKGLGPVIRSGDCTNCGRCIDVCPVDVFRVATRFNDAIKDRPLATTPAGPTPAGRRQAAALEEQAS